MPTPIREAMQMVARLHMMADEIFTTEKVFPSMMDVTERQVQVATYVRGMLMSWDRNPAMYDMTELSDPLPPRKPMEASAVRSDGEKPVVEGKRLNAHAILLKKLEGGKLTKPQFARLCELVQRQRHMTDVQRKKLRAHNLAECLPDIPEGVLQEFVLSEGVV